MQLRTPPDFMDEYILHSLSTVAARSSAGCYCRSWHADIWTRRMLLQIHTFLHMKFRAHMTNTAELSIVCSDSWYHRDYSFTRSQEHDGLWCACKMNVWTPRSDTILKQLIVPANSWQSCHILLCHPLSVLSTHHRRDWRLKDWWCNWKEKRRSNEKMRRHNLWQVRNRKNVKISVNRWELKFPKDWDISQSLGNSQRLGIFKITASWQFNFGKYPKNNREKPRPRPA